MMIDQQNDQAEWLRVTLSSIGDAIITTDCEGRVTFLNPIAESLTGWTLPEAVGQSLHSVIGIINEDARQPVEVPTVQSLREGRTLKLPSHSLLTAKDGTERPISDSAALIRNDQGKVAGLVLVFRDITGRRITERALEKSLAYANDIIATLREPFLVLDHDLRIKTANRSFYTTFHVSMEETENRLVYDLGNGQWDIPGLRELLDGVLSENKSIHDFEVEHTFPTLGRRTMLLNARPFPPASKHPELILLAVEDASALRERVEELAEHDRRRGEFLAMLAHELRNPLAPIRNALQIMRLTGMDRQAVQTASEMMERQVAQMVRLVDDLLDVNRISRGKIELQRERIELGSCIRHAVEAVRSQYKDMSHELIVTLPPQPIYVNGDSTRLAQVMGNVLINACKFTDKGGRISLTAEREGEHVVIRVRDSGIGIAADQLPRIFDLFVQIDSSLERSVSGLGLGLALVKNLVEMHDGTVVVHSAGVGQGSEFVVRLPVIVEPLEPPSPEPTDIVPKAASARRILVVDDNPDSATSLAMLMKITGDETYTAFDGLEAVEVAATFKPDVILLDIGLPTLNGYEACRRIRQQPRGKNIVIVALTGWGQEEDRERSRHAGFSGHMVKPVELAALTKLLADLLPTLA
ncbi:MAG: ATP-binding protein [Pirellulaceae bacterium]